MLNQRKKMTPKFPKPIVLKKVGDMLWEVYEDFEYYVGDPINNELITVPKGFKTDLASVPRLFWQIYPPDGKWTYAALVHDYLYFTQTRTRAEADRIFLEALKEIGVGWVTRRLMYTAVRVGAWLGWKKRKNEI